MNRFVEWVCALLVALMVIDVWFGIVARYVLELGITWTEELARYLMIWAALLAVSCAAHRREHIGLTLLQGRLPPRARARFQHLLDAMGIVFFLFLLVYGVRMTADGGTQFAMIFGMTMTLPYAAVPVSAGLTAFQILVSALAPASGDEGPLPGMAAR